jgi:hypothetical protein
MLAKFTQKRTNSEWVSKYFYIGISNLFGTEIEAIREVKLRKRYKIFLLNVENEKWLTNWTHVIRGLSSKNHVLNLRIYWMIGE